MQGRLYEKPTDYHSASACKIQLAETFQCPVRLSTVDRTKRCLFPDEQVDVLSNRYARQMSVRPPQRHQQPAERHVRRPAVSKLSSPRVALSHVWLSPFAESSNL